MGGHALRPGTRTGLRVVDVRTGETVTHAGRVLDNLSAGAAEEILALIERQAAQREERINHAVERNDLVAILAERDNEP